jgi:pimeloyl-ACP methyl ester carboxylesterase
MTRRGSLIAIAAALAVLSVLAASTATAGPSPDIGLRTLRFVDGTRVARFRTGAVRPRTLTTYVRYPSTGNAPFPLIVFAHGFALAPAVYTSLLNAWTRAGYVVAAPVFPVENPQAPGGPDRADLMNEPGDIRFLITKLLTSRLRGLIDPRRVAVAGHSDGAMAALATAYGGRSHDPRIDAAVIMSGAQPSTEPFSYGPGRPPLLAVQGAADSINAPENTRHFFALARRPKFLLWLVGADHLSPYTTNARQLAVLQAATIAFLDHYLRHGSLQPLLAVAKTGVAQLTADP